jgi:hypothetical protein
VVLWVHSGDRSVSGARQRPIFSRAVSLVGALSLVGTSLFVALTPGLAGATSKPVPANLADFANCPVNVKAVATCLFSSTTSTKFEIGSTTVTSSSPTTLSLGLSYTKTGQPVVVLPTNGTAALQSPAIPLSGGLTGISGLGGGELAVTVTPQLVGLPTVNLGNLLNGSAPGLTLPIDVLVSTPTGLLGSDCTIADSADPITLNLTTGRTNPPPPNTPISGATGTTSSTPRGLITVHGMTLVDNSFAVPGTDNCGTGGILDPILDFDKGLPSAAGSNTAILSGSSHTAPATLVRKDLH